MIDPFGGIKGKELTNTSGFLVDKEEAIKEVNDSIDVLVNKSISKAQLSTPKCRLNKSIWFNIFVFTTSILNGIIDPPVVL